PRNVGVIGLGAGAMISYSEPGERWKLYEIDPDVVRIAQNTNYFTYLSNCARGQFEIIIGDARLRLHEAPDHSFGLLYLDAFSSDVIPMHLLTLDALQLYHKKLAPKGMLAFHLSSRHFELQPLVASLAKAAGFHCYASTRGDLHPDLIAEGGFSS